MSVIDQIGVLLNANAEEAKREKARLAALRDGTPIGELKADYLERIFRRRRLRTAIEILVYGRVPEHGQRQYRAELATIEAELPQIEAQLAAVGVLVKKVRA